MTTTTKTWHTWCARAFGLQRLTAPSGTFDADTRDAWQVCYVCGEAGHLCCAAPADDAVPEPSCFRCGARQHFGFECTVRHGGGAFRGGGGAAALECFSCGGRGHFARDCPRNQSRAGHATGGMGFGGSYNNPAAGGATPGGRVVTWRGNDSSAAYATPHTAPAGAKRRRGSEWEGDAVVPYPRSAGGGGYRGGSGTHVRWDV